MSRFITGSRRKIFLLGLVGSSLGGIYVTRNYFRVTTFANDVKCDNGSPSILTTNNPEIKKRTVTEFAKGFAVCIKAHVIKWQSSVSDKLTEFFFPSQDLPEDWDKHPVKILVASNFDEVALDKSKDVLVKFYADECNPCNDLAPIYDELGEYFKDSEKILIAKMDATSNVLKHTKISTVPQIKLFRSGDNKVIDYFGKKTLQDLIEFVNTRGEYSQA